MQPADLKHLLGLQHLVNPKVGGTFAVTEDCVRAGLRVGDTFALKIYADT